MKGNRRNYYRILHVKPEAPPVIITASYRTLMSKLRHHPDLGGEHEAAALINEAYAVLSDQGTRRQYDRGLRQSKRPQPAPSKAIPGPANPRPVTESTSAFAPPPAAVLRPWPESCQFCRAALPPMIQSETRCRRCESPLAPPPARFAGSDELSGRRALPRVSKTDAVTIYQGWQMPAYRARLRDLSLTGISVITGAALKVGQVIRIVGPSFDVLVAVISCRESGETCAVHGRLLTAVFTEHTGVFVSMKV